MTLPTSLLQLNYSYWKVELTITITSSLSGVSANSTTFVVYNINETPFGGSCGLDRLSGYAIESFFNITCLNWTDRNGIVTKYEYFGNFFFNKNIFRTLIHFFSA